MYRKILVAVDGSAPSLRGLEEAIRLAKATGGRLLLVHVVNEVVRADFAPSVYYEKVLESLREAGTRVLDDAAAIVCRARVRTEAAG